MAVYPALFFMKSLPIALGANGWATLQHDALFVLLEREAMPRYSFDFDEMVLQHLFDDVQFKVEIYDEGR